MLYSSVFRKRSPDDIFGKIYERGSETEMFDDDIDSERPRFSERISNVFDKAEAIYLRILRAAILLIATFLLGYAGWMAVESAYKMNQSPDSVQVEGAKVAPDEITNAEMSTADRTSTGDGKAAFNPIHQGFYADFVTRYYHLFKSRFEPFRQAEDKNLTQEEFDDAFLNTPDRLNAVTSGQRNFDRDKEDLETLLAVMTDAAQKPLTQKRLREYQSAKKVAVQKKVQRTRTVERRGWDSLSTNCDNWYSTPVGCPDTQTVQVPYTETITNMEFPEGTQTHFQIFRAFQDRYVALLDERRRSSEARAESERQSIIDGITEGRLSLLKALQMVGGFLVLMFFFLLIAIERHQRKISALKQF